jgi:Ca-activated chloride channel homolog
MKRWFIVARRLAVVVLVALFWLRPGFGEAEVAAEESRLAVLLVVDRTKSMDATDVGGEPRFDLVRADLTTLTEALPATSFSIVSFASQAVVELPPTVDRTQALQVLEAIRLEDPAEAEGSSLELPLAEVRSAIAGLRAADPTGRVVVVVASDGEDTLRGDRVDRVDDAPDDGYAGLAPQVDGGAVLGYGTEAGGTMPLRRAGEPTRDLVPDPTTGRPAVSRLDASNLQSVAEDLGVAYVRRDPTDGISTVAAQLSAGTTSAGGDVVSTRELTWVFALALLGLVAAELRGTWRELLATVREQKGAAA